MSKRNSSKSKQGKVYVVEDILDTKLVNGVQHYKVLWKNYPPKSCTWEPQSSFNCNGSTLRQFLEARAERQPGFREKIQAIYRQRQNNGSMNYKKLLNQNPSTRSSRSSRSLTRQKQKLDSFRQAQNLQEQVEWHSQHQELGKDTQGIEFKFGEDTVSFEKEFKIISLKPFKDEKNNGKEVLKFYVKENGVGHWRIRQQVNRQHPFEVIGFYEKFIVFD